MQFQACFFGLEYQKKQNWDYIQFDPERVMHKDRLKLKSTVCVNFTIVTKN
ncbi:hypothetical protein D3C80_1564370 [compost metagenome]